MNKLQIFESTDFGTVRTVLIDKEPYFVGKDVAEILGYTNPQKAIRDHVDDEDRTVNESFTVNGTKGLLINESGLYALIKAPCCEGIQTLGHVRSPPRNPQDRQLHRAETRKEPEVPYPHDRDSSAGYSQHGGRTAETLRRQGWHRTRQGNKHD